MDCDMTVYESEATRSKDVSDAERFDASFEALVNTGIGIRRVVCTSPGDLEEGEARSVVDEQGMDSLPICEYQGVAITVGQYPSDQDLADFLDVPDGVLSVDRTKPLSMGNDLPPSCCCGRPR